MSKHFARTLVLVAALILVTGIAAYGQESQSRPAFIGQIRLSDGSPAPDATEVWVVKGACTSSHVHCCSPPTCPDSGLYYIHVQDPGLCGYGTYTVYASYNNPAQGYSCGGSTTATWDAQHDPVTANITMNPCVAY